MGDKSETSLNISDNLFLSKGEIPSIPEDIIYPDELNRYLREQIHYYVHENGMVKKNLTDKEIELEKANFTIIDLTNKLKEYETISNKSEFVTSTQVASSKIVELSKKVREKNAEVESLKTKCSKLEYQILEMKQMLEGAQLIPEKETKPPNELEEQMKKTQDKLTFTINKLLETRNSNIQLKNDLKLANKWLQQEIGDNFETLLASNSTPGNWRGRAQIICDLQQKNSELKEKLKGSQEKVCINKSELSVVQVKSERKLDEMSRDNTELRTANEALKKKIEGLKARCKALESDNYQMKINLHTLTEEGNKNKKIIEDLTVKLANNTEFKQDIKQKEQQIKKLKFENETLNSEVVKQKCIVENMTKQIKQKETELLNLQNRMEEGHFNINSKVDEKVVRRLEGERSKLLELVEVQNKRLDAERNTHGKTQHSLRYEKQRAAKLEACLARMELEQASHRSSSYSSAFTYRQTENTMKDQLELAEENIKALKTRLDIEQHERKVDLQEFSKILQNYDSPK